MKSSEICIKIQSGKTQKACANSARARGLKSFKNGGNFNFLSSTIYYPTPDVLVSSEDFLTQEESCRCNLAVVRFSYGFLNSKKDFKALVVPAARKQIASTGLLL